MSHEYRDETSVTKESHRSDCQRELAHGVKSRRAAVKQLLDELRDSSTRRPVLRKRGDLFLCRDFASDEKPEQGFRERLGPPRSLGKKFLAFRDSLAPETDALLCGN